MIKISRHISQTIEAPFLDTSVTYFAKLWCEDHQVDEEPIAVGVVEELDAECSMVTFTFSAEQIDKFDDGDKLNLVIWNAAHTQDWRERNMYRLVEAHVGGEQPGPEPEPSHEPDKGIKIGSVWYVEDGPVVVYSGYDVDKGEEVTLYMNKFKPFEDESEQFYYSKSLTKPFDVYSQEAFDEAKGNENWASILLGKEIAPTEYKGYE